MKDLKVIMLENNLTNLLSSYLLGQKSLLECIEWFSTIDWGEINAASKVARKIGKLQVISTEVSEGLRLESEFVQEVSKAVADMSKTSCTRYWVSRLDIAIVSSSSTGNFQNNIVMSVADQESLSWNISPQEVSA
jgi:hypothetical protein